MQDTQDSNPEKSREKQRKAKKSIPSVPQEERHLTLPWLADWTQRGKADGTQRGRWESAHGVLPWLRIFVRYLLLQIRIFVTINNYSLVTYNLQIFVATNIYISNKKYLLLFLWVMLMLGHLSDDVYLVLCTRWIMGRRASNGYTCDASLRACGAQLGLHCIYFKFYFF